VTTGMSGTWSHIARCLTLREEDIALAIRSRESTRELLARMAEVSAPDTGAAKALLVFARMATTACEWLEGDLRVELAPDGDGTVANLATDLGGGLLERALPRITFRAPLAEFTRAVERVPRMIAPLQARTRTERLLVLTASALVRKTSFPPPPIEIAAESLLVRAPAPLPAKQAVGPESGPLPVVGSEGPTSEPPVDSVDKGWGD
jgi:hypothetical protein